MMLEAMKFAEREVLPVLRERRQLQEEKAERQLRQWRGEKGACSLLLHVTDSPLIRALPDYDMYEIHYDDEKMFLSQLKGALSSALSDGDAVPSVRANVGCGAINTLLGGLKQTFFGDKMPWLLSHLSPEELNGLTIENIEESEEFKRGLEQMRFMKEMLKGTGVSLYPMDLQGPIDMAHLFLGDEFFYQVYDDPDIIHKALELSCACAVYAMEKNFEIIEPGAFVCHYNDLVLPKETPIKISEDTSTLLSKAHLFEYMKPYTEKLLAHFGGGYIHYCGDNKHLYGMIPEIEGNRGLNFGNPERHNPAEVFSMLNEKRMCYYGAFPSLTAAEQARMSKREDGSYGSFTVTSCRMDDQQRVIEEFRERVG
ncbi:MAG: hypothetical protein IJC48_03235 [Clostridia bacterium]|nr:hypothetical protein [Clostridia bacterium]